MGETQFSPICAMTPRGSKSLGACVVLLSLTVQNFPPSRSNGSPPAPGSSDSAEMAIDDYVALSGLFR